MQPRFGPVAAARRTVSRVGSVRVAVAGVVLLALAARLFALGSRVAHQDEARVAYWAYRYAESGVYWYRPVVHGPFLTIVNGNVFALLGASDFTMRLVPALVGGLLPLGALLFRQRLRDSETVALALLLAANPLLLYFSRFYRNDLLLAGFMLVAVGFFVRAYDHRRPAYLYAGTAAFALAVTTKENALVYPVCWFGAAALLWDRRLLRESDETSALSAAADRVRRVARGVWRWRIPFAVAVFEFFAVVVFFYAPRGAGANASPTLGGTLRDPTLLPALVGEATLGSWHEFTGKWVGGNDHSYLWTAKSLWPALAEGGAVVLAFAALGFLVDRYSGESPRDVVGFAFFWGASSLAGYPVIVDNPFPWEVVHVVVPLAIPAAVGLALVARLGAASIADGDGISAAAAAVVLVLVVAQVGGTAVATSYLHPQSDDNELVQYAQSGSEMKPLLGDLRRISNVNDGIDVLYYGATFYAADERSLRTPPGTGGWFDRLPLAWYLEAAGATTDSTTRPGIVGADPPPVVVALGNVETCDEPYANASDIDHHLRDYERHEVHRFLHDSGCHKSSLVVFVAENASERAVALDQNS
ncbi:TIGR03663 family protein [Halorussus gelatinilyticus]|uniref:TIGR03663 family protein n=1 Tax=Halorussus gelatinilyticus TaxID=2937524 RepID=A0A8U0IKR5_9EURY|nr:flippase activity-associated protein Agl23 [Halorussus gelatinilyticus]UPW00804.1 TIGR03663 family protein [Halorussus gelatinilyticus]